jgi:putative oxidoreductase
MRDWAALPLRLGLGIMFVLHGLQIAFGMFGGTGIEGFSQMLSSLGFSPATPLAYIVAYFELIGGILLILGLFTRVASIVLILVMLVAIIKVHLSNGFFAMSGGFEYNFIIICACASLLISGPGHLSIHKKT